MADEVKFSKGLSTNIPFDKVSGRILIEIDTGNMYLDSDSNTRIELGSSQGSTSLPETTMTVDLSSDTSEKFDGTKDVDLGVKNILPIKHGGLGNDRGYVQTGSLPDINNIPSKVTLQGSGNVSLGDFGRISGQYCGCYGDNSLSYGMLCASGGRSEGLVFTSTAGYSDGQIVFDTSYCTIPELTIDQVVKVGDMISGVLISATSDELIPALVQVSEVTSGSLEGAMSVTCRVIKSDTVLPSGTLFFSTPYISFVDPEGQNIRGKASGKGCQCTHDCSVVQGNMSMTMGECGSANGYICFVGDYGYARGLNCQASSYQWCCCRYPSKSSDGPKSESDMSGNLLKLGNGTPSKPDSNAFRVATSGVVYGNGEYNTSGADYAEMFEWIDGNPENQSRQGLFVTLDGEKIKIAQADDTYILGVVSTSPAIVGDSYFGDNWHNMYQRDVFNQIVTETVEVPSYVNSQGHKVPEHKEIRYKLNPEYDPQEEYVPRSERKEWSPVGLIGKLIVVDDGTCQVNGYCTCGIGGIATKSDSGYRVMSRIDSKHIRILLEG